MTITEQLRKAITDSGETHYRIGKESGVDIRSLDWFISRQRPHIRSDTMDRLCDYFDLELRKKSGTTAKKQTAKKKRATLERTAKKSRTTPKRTAKKKR